MTCQSKYSSNEIPTLFTWPKLFPRKPLFFGKQYNLIEASIPLPLQNRTAKREVSFLNLNSLRMDQSDRLSNKIDQSQRLLSFGSSLPTWNPIDLFGHEKRHIGFHVYHLIAVADENR